MSKFKITLKLQGLELDIEGSKDDIPHISKSVANQLAGLISPAASLASSPSHELQPKIIGGGETDSPRKPKRKKANNNRPVTGEQQSTSLDWVHSPEKWGTPQQTWNTADKSIWLLYVAGKEKTMTELSQPQITATFNKHFRQAGLLKASNVSRDLGKKKTGTRDAPALVGENTTMSPSAWFLTEAGQKHAENLIAGN